MFFFNNFYLENLNFTSQKKYIIITVKIIEMYNVYEKNVPLTQNCKIYNDIIGV
jgi:hypothetical protein